MSMPSTVRSSWMTSSPRSSRWRTRWTPTKPPAPVTSALTGGHRRGSSSRARDAAKGAAASPVPLLACAFGLPQGVLDGSLELLPLHLQVLEAEDPQPDRRVHRVLDPPRDLVGRRRRHQKEGSRGGRLRKTSAEPGGPRLRTGPSVPSPVVVESEEQPLACPPVLAVVVMHGLHADRFEVLLGALA